MHGDTMIVFHSPHNSSAKHLIGIQISTHFDGSVLGHGIHVGISQKVVTWILFCVTINRIVFSKMAFFKNVNFIGVLLIYNVMFVPSVQQSDPVICIQIITLY